MAITEGTQPAAVTWTNAWTTPGKTTASFTPEAGALLVALGSGDGSAAGCTGSITDSLGGSWTLLKRQNANVGTVNGACEVWVRDSPGVSLTVTWTNTANGSTGGQLVVRTLLGAKVASQQTGATNGTTVDPAAVQVSVTAGTGNRIYGSAFNFANSTVMTPLGNTSVINAFSDTTNGDTWEAFKSSADTAGTATYGYSTSTSGMIAAVEILAAPAAGGLTFRPGKTWKRRYKHRQRLPFPPVSGVDVRSDTGLAMVGLSADATTKKVAVVSATSSLGLIATPVATKVSKSTGIGAVGLAANAVHVDVRSVTVLATVGLTSTSTAKKVTPTTSVGTVGLAGISTARKVAKSSGTGTAGLAGFVTARKVAPAIGRGTVGLQASFAHVEIHPITAIGGLGLTAYLTGKKRATPLAAGTVGLAGNILPKKISKSTGVGTLGVLGSAVAGKRASITGRSPLGLASWWEHSLAIPKAGQIEPGTRTFAGIGPGLRAGASTEPGTRGAAAIAIGAKRGAQAEPGTRKGPNVEGGV